MSARLFAFPQARRVRLIRTTAAQMSDAPRDRGERALASALERQRASMVKKGFAPDLVDQEIRSLELAIRARLWSIVMQNGGAA